VTSAADSGPAAIPATERSDDPGAGPAYHAAVAALSERGRFGIRLGLGRTRALLRELGDPQLGVRGALVAGTNGKGSVLALAGSALRAAGLRAGETPKPHLVSYRERLQIGGRPVDPDTFARLVRAAIAAADRVPRRLGDPTEFELLTAVVFRWFADEGVDLALVEVGLGGRLDATHAWDGGVAAITNVDLDHTDRLGPTVALIAREKAAIIERGDLAVTGAVGEARTIVQRRAARLGVPLTIAEPAPVLAVDRDGLVVELPRLGRTRVGLRGRHQAANVAVADALLDALAAAGIADVPAEARRRGYAGARWPGRLELLEVDGRDILLDGAHNPAGAAALAAALDELRPFLGAGRLTLLTASMADKDVAGIVAALSRATALAAARIVTTAVSGPRALPAAELAATWSRAEPAPGNARRTVTVEPDPAVALDRILAGPTGPLVVAGSLYLVGAVRARLGDDLFLRDPPPSTALDVDPGDNRP
jgi:dihydrofolate synthase / folylpolyglutamate synthase